MPITRRLIPRLTAAFLGLAATAQAQSQATARSVTASDALLLENIPSVFGASRFDQLSTEAPASVTVLTRDDIATHGWRTLGDVLAGVRGIYVIHDGLYASLGARAFGRPGDYNSRTLLAVDGHRLNESIYDSGLLGTESIVHVDDIERVEIIRGPASSLYGNSAFFGVVNVVTTRGRAQGGARGRVAMESFGTREAMVAFGNRYANGLELSANVSRRRSDGRDFFFQELDTSATGGWARGLDGDRRDHARVRLDWGHLEATGIVNRRNKDMATARYGVDFGAAGTSFNDDQAFLGLSWNQPLGRRSSARVRASYNDYDYDGTYVYSGEGTTDWSLGRWAVLEAEYSSSHFDGHKIVVGAQRIHNLQQDQGYREGDEVTFFSDARDAVTAGFVQDEVRLGRDWLLNGGLRLDHYTSFGSTLNPRLGVIYSPRPGSAVKALYGRAFRAPNVYERLYEAPDIRRNPGLEPERITTTELLLEHSVTPHLKMTAVVFHNDVEGLIDFVGIDRGVGQYQNAGRATSRGAELEAEIEWQGVRGRVAHAWQRGRDRSASIDLSNAPRHLTSANIQLPLGGAFTGSIEARAMTSRWSASRVRIPGYAVANAWASARVPRARAMQFSFGVYNLFDARYADPTGDDFVQSSIPQPERSFRVQVEVGRP